MPALPREPTPLLGRDADAEQVRRLLATTRLLTLAGTGGCGKTRLALHVAHGADPVWWVDLATLSDPELVEFRVARAVGVADAPGREIRTAIADQLGDGLVVLDNCEHVIDACAAFVQWALTDRPGLRLLTTSRQPLGVAGETTWPVPPLSLSAAVALFVQRASADRPGFALSEVDTGPVAELCRRLDGLPLAIELAAARARMLSPRQLLERLADDQSLLAGRGRDTPARQRTLLSTMDWSHGLLTPEEQRTFRRLAVFEGRFDLEAAERVAADDGGPDGVLDRLTGLVEKSLVVVEPPQPGDAARYRLLHTVRGYARSRLAEAGEAERARAAHTDWALELAARARTGLAGAEQRQWIARLDADHDNLVAALHDLDRADDAVRGLRLLGCLGRYWWYAGRFSEGTRWLTRFVDRAAAFDYPVERAAALHALGLACFWHESPEAGVDAARERFEEAVVLYRQLGDRAGLAATLRDLGCYWKGHGDFDRAREALTESVSHAEAIGDRAAVAAAASYFGIVAAYEGQLATARQWLEQCLAVLPIEAGGDEASRSTYFLACLDCEAGDAASARVRLQTLMALETVRSLPYTAGFALDGMARLAVAEGQPTKALRMAGAARAAHTAMGTSAGPSYDTFIHSGLRPAVARLGPAAAERAWAEGARLSVADAFAEGLSPADPPGRRVDPSGRTLDPLSDRETEVLRLAAIGLGDGDIAARLHLSRRTVGNHLGSVYRKLDVPNRTAAVHTARERGLLDR